MGKKGRRCKTRWRRLPMGGEAEDEEEDCPSALGGRERGKGGEGASSPNKAHAPYKGGVGGARGKGSFGRRNGGPVTDGNKKAAAGYTFNEDEYTKITTPRQDVLFKKGYLMARKKEPPTSSSSTETTNGEANGTTAPLNGDASSDQTYSAQVSGSGEDDSGGCNGYAYVNTNGFSYGYHMDHAAANGGAYFVNGGSYEIYDPYAATGYAFPYAPPPLPPLHAVDWYTSRPLGSTANMGEVQWCHLMANPGYAETRRKRYSTDSQNCSPPSSESTGPPGSPQEEGASSGDHTHQPIPQYHHAHVFHPPAAAAAYVYPGYLFGPAVYSVNGTPFPAIHPLHGISQSIHAHPSSPAPPAAPGSDGGSQRRRKKKRRRKRRRGLTDEASEETSSEAGEEEGGACGGEEYDGEDGPVVVVRLGNVGPLVMNQQQTGSPPPFTEGVGSREAEASSTDCSELSGQPESSSGAEESIPTRELEDRVMQVEDEVVPKSAFTRDVEASAQGDFKLLESIAKKEVSVNAETKEVSTQSPPEMAMQVNVPVMPLPSPVTPSYQMQIPLKTVDSENKDGEVKEEKEELNEQKQKEDMLIQIGISKQKRKNGGGFKNGNNQSSQSAKAAHLLEKAPESEHIGDNHEKTGALESLLTQSNLTEFDSEASLVTTAIGETIDKVLLLKEETPLKPMSMEEKIEVDMFPVISMPVLDQPKKEDLHNSSPNIITELKDESPKTLDLDSFAFKPEPYKHPMLKPLKQEEEELILSEDCTISKEMNSEYMKLDEAEKRPTEDESSLSRNLEEIPRRRTRLKEPPERNEAPGMQVPSSKEIVEKAPEPEVKNIISLEDERKGETENKLIGFENLPLEIIEPAGMEEGTETPPETLTELVSKWLEENSDALPENTEEIMEKTEEEKKAKEVNLTGSKNGVGNPFPVPSSREKVTLNECESVTEHECLLNMYARVSSRDGPVKRVANSKIGKVQESKDKYDNGGRRSEESDESCEWESMTVEATKKNFGDLETWKRLRGGMGGSSEAIRSLGSYKGTDDEEEEERRKLRESMCDPSSSVAKYYCLGSRDNKSASPEEGLAQSKILMQTDSGVQSDADDDTVATAEEAFEESTVKGKTLHRGVGLGKTAAFVVRQIGTTDAGKGPFPCGICCIIQ